MNIAHVDFSPNTRSLDIFVSGCNPPFCEGCCNLELVSFKEGKDFSEWKNYIVKYMYDYGDLIKNVFLLGGSFNHQVNGVENFFMHLEPAFYNKDVWLFAREELNDIQPIFKERCKYIKCGAYIPALSCEDNVSQGVKLATSNQKVFVKGVDYE